ncbi:MAG: hypothetical protein RIC51_00505, partial [Erythrobacter sp.]
IASHHLEALGEEEIEAYVTHRLAHVGWDGRPALADGLMQALYRASEGIPRRINQLMNRLLLLGAIEEEETLTPVMLASVVDEMAGDEQRGALRKQETGAASPAAPSVQERKAEMMPSEDMASLLAQRDARTAQLEAAILELQAAGAAAPEDTRGGDVDPALAETIRRLEARLEEQEQSLRHVLTMLIEWFEDDIGREAA